MTEPAYNPLALASLQDLWDEIERRSFYAVLLLAKKEKIDGEAEVTETTHWYHGNYDAVIGLLTRRLWNMRDDNQRNREEYLRKEKEREGGAADPD